MLNLYLSFKKTNKIYWFFVFLVLIVLLIAVINSNKVIYALPDPSSEEAQHLKEKLKKQIQEVEKQISGYEILIEKKQKEAMSLENELYIIQKKINKQVLEIRETNLSLEYINEQIKDSLAKIADLEDKTEIEKKSLSEYLKLIYKYDNQPFLFLILKGNLSDFFNELYTIEKIQKQIHILLSDIEKLKNQLNIEKNKLEDQREEMSSILNIQKIQRDNLVKTRSYKRNILSQTKGQEYLFQRYLKKAKKTAAQIRKQLYVLEGWGISLNFEEAYKRAKKIGDKVGIRPAFLLALLKVESNWGKNVGKGNWKKDMKPTQYKAFLKITNELGLNPDEVPVSKRQVCPNGSICGWGGALGPAQFLPSTWLSYKEKIAKITGHNPPSPWNIDDAFAAAAIKLRDAGAYKKTYYSEWKAAMIYFAGSRWNRKIYRFYGNSVMALAKKIQNDIDIMTQNM